jgi:membrane protein implicated in regulation of membrane protease activity
MKSMGRQLASSLGVLIRVVGSLMAWAAMFLLWIGLVLVVPVWGSWRSSETGSPVPFVLGVIVSACSLLAWWLVSRWRERSQEDVGSPDSGFLI